MPKRPKPPRGGTGGNIPAPTGLAAVVNDGAVDLSWNAVANATSYWIYRNDVVQAIVTVTNFTDNYATAGYSLSYQVAAVVASVLGPKCASVTINSLNIAYTATE